MPDGSTGGSVDFFNGAADCSSFGNMNPVFVLATVCGHYFELLWLVCCVFCVLLCLFEAHSGFTEVRQN